MLDVYSPREDSFLLENVLLKQNFTGKKCLDLGTGSGIQGIAMLKANAKEIWFVDINENALICAKKNLITFLKKNRKKFKHKFLDNSFFSKKFRFVKSNLFSSLGKEKFDLIAFNPPYVPSDEVKWFDTDGGKEGMVVIESFLFNFDKHLTKNGVLFLLYSSLNDSKKIFKILEKKGFSFEIVARTDFFFERIFVLKAKRV